MRFGWLLVPLLLAPVPARAQLPIPQLRDVQGPELRMAGTDAFADRVRSFKTRLEKTAASRREANARERERIESLIEQHRRSPGTEAFVGPALDPELATKVLQTIDQEEELLAEAIALAGRAFETAQPGDDDPDQPKSFDRLVELMLATERLEGEAAAGEAVAERLEAMAELGGEPARAGDSLADVLISQEWHLQAAQIEHATAGALETRSRARAGRARLEQARRRLSVTMQDALQAEEELARVESEVEEARRELLEQKRKLKRPSFPVDGLDPETARAARESERATTLAKLELIDTRRGAEQARALQAQARAIAIRALFERRTPDWPARLAPARIAATMAAIRQQQTSIETRLARVREQEERLRRTSMLRKMYRSQRRVLDDTLDVLRETRHRYEAVHVIQRAAEPLSGRGRAPRSIWLSVLFTLGTLILAVLLLTVGLRRIHGLIDADTGTLKLPLRWAGQIRTAIALMWPLFVVASAAALIVWPIWEMDVTLGEAIRTIDRPIFYVDEKPVSVFSIFQICFVLWASVVLSRAIRDFLSARVYRHLGWDIGLTNALNTLVHYVVLLIGIIVAIRFLGIGASSFAILFGVLGIGIGFGLRNIAENFISGLIILAERPIKIGDFVEIDGRVEGQIAAISARSTTVITRDNVSLIIPNSEFVGQRVTNWSHGDPKVRVRVAVGVAFGSDTDLVRKTLLEVASRHGQVLKKPLPEVQFTSFGASKLEFILLVWIEEQFHRFRIASDLHFAIDKAFRKIGIEIAFPQMDLHIKTVSPASAKALHLHASAEEPQAEPLGLPEGPARGSPPHKTA